MPGRLRGLVIGAHGSSGSSETGIDADNIPALGMLSEYLDPRRATIVFSHCYSGEGGSESDNIVNRAMLFFGRRHGELSVVGCDGLQVDIDFELDDDGEIREETLRLRSLASRLTFGLIDDNYVSPPRDELYGRRFESMRRECEPTVSNEWLGRALSLGICNISLINDLFRRQITPERYLEYTQELARLGISLRPSLLTDCVAKNLDTGLIRRYVESRSYELMGVGASVRDIEFFGLGITAALTSAYRNQITGITDDQIMFFRRKGASPSDLECYRRIGMTNIDELMMILERGIPPGLVAILLSEGRTPAEIAAGNISPRAYAVR